MVQRRATYLAVSVFVKYCIDPKGQILTIVQEIPLTEAANIFPSIQHLLRLYLRLVTFKKSAKFRRHYCVKVLRGESDTTQAVSHAPYFRVKYQLSWSGDLGDKYVSVSLCYVLAGDDRTCSTLKEILLLSSFSSPTRSIFRCQLIFLISKEESDIPSVTP